MTTAIRNQRNFARVTVRIRARFRVVRGEEAGAVEQKLREGPSVWAPEGESELVKLASHTGPGADGALARAILDISRQIARLNDHAFAATGPAAVGEFVQLSGGGGLMETDVALTELSLLDLRFADSDFEAPPIRVLAEVRPGRKVPGNAVPLRFLAVHDTDRERLIRFVHSLQRRELRQASRRDD